MGNPLMKTPLFGEHGQRGVLPEDGVEWTILETAVDRFLPLGTPHELQLSCPRARSPQG